jgi:hypothetical protein
MPAACGNHQQRLADRVPALGRAIEQKRADFVGALRAARLARRDRLFPRLGQRGYQQLLLRRLAGALSAFQRDELAAGQFFFPKSR